VSLSDSGSPEIIAFVVVGALAVVMRWVFKPSRKNRVVSRMDASDARELGLLTVIGTFDRAGTATMRGRLADVGIRASASLRRDGRFDVLVFTQDADRARELLG
jgi:hypothetical protein